MTQLEQSQKKIFANYTANETDSVLFVDTTTQVVEIYINQPLKNDTLVINDLGNASTNKIVVRSNQLINGSNSYTINTNYSSLELTYNASNSTYIAKEIPSTDFVFVYNKFDLPEAVNGVITLLENATYYFLTHVDLLGDRLVCLDNTTILGASSENCSITSTGLSASEFLIYTDYTLPIRHITIKDITKAIGINTSDLGAQPIALDWTGVNFSGCTTNLDCGEIDNFIFSKGAILDGGTIKFTSSVGTIGIDNSLFVGSGAAENLIEISSTATITRRFRIIYSSFVATSSTIAVNVNVSAAIPVEGYILDTINFTGGGTYLSGVQYTDNKTRFVNCKGIDNTAEIGNYYMTNNATASDIISADTPIKIAGTTTANSINQKFTHTDNKLTYVGALIRDFQISANASFTSGNNQVIGLYVAKNGVVISSSEMYATTSGSGRAESINCQTITSLDENDYIEMWIENATSTNDIVVEYLNVIVKSLN